MGPTLLDSGMQARDFKGEIAEGKRGLRKFLKPREY
jgi:hypothetical protein